MPVKIRHEWQTVSLNGVPVVQCKHCNEYYSLDMKISKRYCHMQLRK